VGSQAYATMPSLFVEMGPPKLFPRLASNFHPPDLCLPYSGITGVNYCTQLHVLI
jgi:hypothetical protein